MAVLFDVEIPAISKHLTNVFESGELKEEATIQKIKNQELEVQNWHFKHDGIDFAPFAMSTLHQHLSLPSQTLGGIGGSRDFLLKSG